MVGLLEQPPEPPQVEPVGFDQQRIPWRPRDQDLTARAERLAQLRDPHAERIAPAAG